MADRQDIDALMIGALYGELDAAESARLDAHLSKHPEDRAAMDGLTRTRAALRENLETMPAAEPPQAISAVLLQAAARHAPARKAAVEPEGAPGLWTRFVEWMRPAVMNPALGGVAALLLIGGAATVLFVRSGGESTEPVRSEDTVARNAPGSGAPAFHAEQPETPEAVAPPADGLLKEETENAALQLDQIELDRRVRDEAQERSRSGKLADPGVAMAPDFGGKSAGAKADKPKPTKGGDGGGAGAGYATIEARDVAPPVKDPFAEGEADADDASGDEESVAVADNAGRGAAKATAQAPEPKPVDPALEEWAKGAHSRLVKLVRDNKCNEAGRLGAEIKDRAPEYYAAHVANDRAIRSCKQYIEGQAKKKADKDYKSRSQGNAVDLEASE